VSAVELTDDEKEETGVSPGLITSAVQRIAGKASGMDARSATPWRPILKFVGAFVVFAGLFQVAYVMRPDAVLNALARLFQPTKEIPYYCYTKLEVEPGDCVVRTGDAVEVRIRTWGQPAKEAILTSRNGGEPMAVRLACEDGCGVWQSAALFETLMYQVEAGDAVSEWHRIQVVAPPALRSRGARVRAPEYAGRREIVMENVQGALEVVAGSEVKLVVEPVRRGDDARFVCRGEMMLGGKRVPMEALAGGRLGSPVFAPTESGEYVIELMDGYGLTNRAPENVLVRVVADALPRATITSPGRDVLVLSGEVVEVEAGAEDEFGLRELALAWSVMDKDKTRNKGTWMRQVLAEGNPETATLSGKMTLDVAAMGLKAGEVLEYRSEASDYAGDALMRVGTSPTYRITVISEEEHLNLVLARLKAIEMKIRAQAARQKAEAAEVGKLAEGKEGEEGKEEKANAAEEREREIARTTEAIAREVEGLIPELTRNPSASAELLAQMEKLGRSVRSVSEQPMGEAVKQLSQAGKSGESEQKENLSQAQENEQKAAKELERLASAAAAMQRESILERLAAEAERLAARQRELKEESVRTGLKTAGMDPKDIPAELKSGIERLTMSEGKISEGVQALAKGINDAAGTLIHTKPADAQTAEKAGEKLRSDKVAEEIAGVLDSFEKNVMFAEADRQEKVATSLTEVAKILRQKADSEEMEQIAKELEEFIRRQTELNEKMKAAKVKGAQLGGEQATLERDVREQAAAIQWLAQEIQLFKSQTAQKLEAASDEMGLGAGWLYRSGYQEGLEHGEKALALLIGARDAFKEERKQMQGASQNCASMEAILLLQRILVGQKQLLKSTGETDQLGRSDMDAFTRRTVELASRQSRLVVDAKRLEAMLALFAGAARVVGEARGRMDLSRLALEGGDPGNETRVVQRQAIALLEKLMEGQCKGMGQGLASARMMAMMQMMQGMGMNPGGYAGGGNAPILPASLRETGETEWAKVRSRFDEQLGAEFEGEYPAEYRKLLDAYFSRLRKEPMR